VRCRDQDLPSDPDGHNESHSQEHAAGGTRPVAFSRTRSPTTAKKALAHHLRGYDQESRRETLREDELQPTASPEGGRKGIGHPTMTSATARRRARRMSAGNFGCILRMLVHPRTGTSSDKAGENRSVRDCEEDRMHRVVLVGILREDGRWT
jgi:hypothetical protein